MCSRPTAIHVRQLGRVHRNVRAEWFNVLKDPIFTNPGTQVGRGGFGKAAAQANLPRQTQLALKIIF